MLPGQVPLDLVGPWQVLHCAQRLSSAIEVRYFGPCDALDWLGPLRLTGIEALPDSVAGWDLLLVPGQYAAAIEPHGQAVAVDWLRRHANDAATLMSICSGTLLLAQAGLLSGRRCTTHHGLLEQLTILEPRAKVQGDCIFAEDGPLLTSAGISTGIDTMLYWLTRHGGHRLAVSVAREMVLYLRRSGHEPQLGIWLKGRNHVDARIHRLQDCLAESPAEAWTLAAMASESSMSERHLRRRFQALTGMGLPEYLARVRLHLARSLMQETSLGLNDIAERVGLGDDRQLRRVWQRFGEGAEEGSPARWRRRNSSISSVI